MKEEVIIDIQLEDADNEKQVENLTKSIVELQNESKELIKINKELVKSGDTNSKEYIENTKQLEVNKQKISENTSSRKGLIQAIIAEEDSIKALRVRNAELLKQRDQLSTKTEDGRRKIEQINKEVEKNTKTIHTNSTAIEKQKFNIGNYGSALDKLIPGLGGAVTGIQAMTKASLAFIATPIGLILTAIVGALALITSYFRSSGDGADRFAKISKQLSTIVDVLVDRISSFVRALIAFSTGNWSEGVTELSNTFSGLGDELEREIKLAGDLADALDLLEDQQKDYEVSLSSTRNQIKELIIQSKDRTLAEEERIKLLNKALDLERSSNTQLLALREESLRIAAEEAALRANTSQKEGETLEEFAKRLIQNQQLSDDLRDGVREALKALNEGIGESLNLQEKIDNQINALEEKRAENRKKRDEEQTKAVDKRAKELNDAYKKQLEEQELANEREAELRALDGLDQESTLTAELERMSEQHRKEFAAEKQHQNEMLGLVKVKTQAEIDLEKLKNIIALQATANQLGMAANLFKKHTLAYKALATGEALINTYTSAVAAYKAMVGIPYVGPILAPIAAATAVATGLATIAKINAIEIAGFAMGGRVGGALSGTRVMPSDGTPISRSNGDNRLVTVRTNEVILNERQQAALGGSATFRRIGVPDYDGRTGFAGGGFSGIAGGFASREASRAVSNNYEIRQLVQAVNNIKVVQNLQDFEIAQARKNQPILDAQVM